jgi:predicted negative regulator of RcsB-dependent stress response
MDYKPYIINIIKNSPIGKVILKHSWKQNKYWFISGGIIGLSIGIIIGYKIHENYVVLKNKN